jgi:hypothetical protein
LVEGAWADSGERARWLPDHVFGGVAEQRRFAEFSSPPLARASR